LRSRVAGHGKHFGFSTTDESGYFGFIIEKSIRSSETITLYADSKKEQQSWIQELSKSARTIPYTDFYEKGRMLGKGKFSVVYEATHVSTSMSRLFFN